MEMTTQTGAACNLASSEHGALRRRTA